MLTEDALDNGIEIGGDRYRMTGMVHRRGGGDWSASIKRTDLGGWHCLGKNSAPELQEEKNILLSDVVLVLVSKENADSPVTAAGW